MTAIAGVVAIGGLDDDGNVVVLRANSDGTLSGSGGSGTVTSVGIAVPSILSVSDSPVTTSGTITIGLTDQAANRVLAGPDSGADAAPTFRALVSDDIPALAASKITSGVLAVARLGSGTPDTTKFLRGDGAWSNTLTGQLVVGGVLQVSNGSVSAPSIRFDVAADYGFFWQGGVGTTYSNGGTGVIAFVDGFGISLASTQALGWSSTSAASASNDLMLRRDAANVLAQRNSTNPQILRIYNTYTDASNYERLSIQWSGNTCFINTESAGTGSDARQLQILTNGGLLTLGSQGNGIHFRASATDRWELTAGGHLLALADNTYDIGASGANRPRSIYVGQDGLGVSIYMVGALVNSQDSTIYGPSYVRLGSDTYLLRDAANILAQRNSTDAQVLRVYGTYTDSSNYERLAFVTAAGDYLISPQAAGSGTLRGLQLGASGGRLGFFGTTATARSTGWAVSNVSSDKVLDANSTSIDELADVIGTLITELLAKGLISA